MKMKSRILLYALTAAVFAFCLRSMLVFANPDPCYECIEGVGCVDVGPRDPCKPCAACKELYGTSSSATGSGSSEGAPSLEWRVGRMNVAMVHDPFRLHAAKGPAFGFRLINRGTDTGEAMNGRPWQMGRHNRHNYEWHIDRNGDTYYVQDEFDNGVKFLWNGSDFVEQRMAEPHIPFMPFGSFKLERDGDKIVVYRACPVCQQFPGSNGGAGVCGNSGDSGGGGGCSSGSCAQPQGAPSPARKAWHTKEAMIFERRTTDNDIYHPTEIVARDGHSLTIEYTEDDLIDHVTMADGNTVTFTYNDDNLISHVQDSATGRSAHFTYTSDRSLEEVTDMGGQTFGFEFKGRNRQISAIKRPNSAGGWDTTTINLKPGSYARVQYPDGKNAYLGTLSGIYRIDNRSGLGETRHYWDFDYTWGIAIAESVDPKGRRTSYTYYDEPSPVNIIGKLKTKVDPSGLITSYTYDSRGNIATLSFSNASGLIEKTIRAYTYFPGTDSPSSATVTVEDGSGNVLSKNETTYELDDNGTPADTTDDIYLTVSEKSWSTPTIYSETTYHYNTNTWLLSEVRALVSGTDTYRTIKSYSYDADSRVTAVYDALSNAVHTTYDSFGRLASTYTVMSDGSTNTTSYTYDLLDRMIGVAYPDGTSESWVQAPCGCGMLIHTNRGGTVTSNSFNSTKLVSGVTVTTANGTVLSSVTYQYDSAGHITNTTDLLGNSQSSIYNSAGELVKSVDSLGRVTEYRYDAYGRQYMTIYPDGTTSVSTYDAAGRVVRTDRFESTDSVTPLQTHQYTYDAIGRRVTSTDPVGTVVSNTYDMMGRVVKVSKITSDTYTETEYDLLGNVVKQIGPVYTDATAQDRADATTSNSYDELNRVVTTTDPEGRTTTREYDADFDGSVKYMVNDNGRTNQVNYYDLATGRLLSNTVNGVTMVHEYNAVGSVTKTIYPDGSYTESIYDGPRVVSQISRTGNTNSFAFDAAGRRIAVTNSLGKVTKYAYDAVGNVTNMTDALNNSTKYAYDVMNRVTVTTLPDGRVSVNQYDALGRLASRSGAGSVPVSYEYDAAGKMTKLIDGEGNKTRFFYDCCQLTSKVYPDDTSYSYAYDARGRLLFRTDAKDVTTAYFYNNVGQVTNVDYATDTDIRYAYDNLGRMTSRVDAAGAWSWTYDGESSRVLTEVTPHSRTVSYTYNTNDTYQLASVSLDATHRTDYEWSNGRLTKVIAVAGAATNVFDYEYLAGSDLLEKTTYLNGVCAVDRTYDDVNRLLTISATNTAGTINSFTYWLDKTGRRTKRTDADGSHIDWGYDKYDQLTSAAKTNSANAAMDAAYKYGYRYDKVGNRLHEDRAQLDLDGTFNTLNQLTSRDWGGKLSLVGQVDNANSVVLVDGMTNAPPFYNATNWLGGGTVHAGSNSIPIVVKDGANGTETNQTVYMPATKPQQFTYDANGNLTSDGYRLYTWNNENRLTTIETDPSYADLSRRKSEFVYDGLGRRARRIDYSDWSGAGYATSNETAYVYDGWNLLSELTASNTIASYHVWGLDLSQSIQGAGGIGGLLAAADSSDTVRLFTYDGNGNVKDVLDDTGSSVAAYTYDPFGRLVNSTGPYAEDNKWRFSTKPFEEHWGLYYYGYRSYSPSLGRWCSRDPLGEAVFLRRRMKGLKGVERRALRQASLGPAYFFVANGSVNEIDRLGLISAECLGRWEQCVSDASESWSTCMADCGPSIGNPVGCAALCAYVCWPPATISCGACWAACGVGTTLVWAICAWSCNDWYEAQLDGCQPIVDNCRCED